MTAADVGAGVVVEGGLRLAVVFAIAAGALVLARHSPQAGVLRLRAMSWAAIAATWLAALALAPAGPVVLGAAIAVVGAREYGRLVSLPRVDRVVLATTTAALPIAVVLGPAAWAAVLVLCALASTVPALLTQDAEHGGDRVARILLGLLWIAGGASAVAALPVPALLALGVAVALADIGAFVAGSTMQGPPLAPRLSPSKRLSGLIGALMGTLSGLLLVADLVELDLTLLPAIVVGVTLCATWGDLLESLVKRGADVKDAGSWLPGFGGLLDRADSLLVTAPAWWAASVALSA